MPSTPAPAATATPILSLICAAHERLGELVRDIWPRTTMIEVAFPDAAWRGAYADRAEFHIIALRSDRTHPLGQPGWVVDFEEPCPGGESPVHRDRRRDWHEAEYEARLLVSLLIRHTLDSRDTNPSWEFGWPEDPTRLLYLDRRPTR